MQIFENFEDLTLSHANDSLNQLVRKQKDIISDHEERAARLEEKIAKLEKLENKEIQPEYDPPLCPFCGVQSRPHERMKDSVYCPICGFTSNKEHFSNRPIEDKLNARIAELENRNDRLFAEILKCNAELINISHHLLVYSTTAPEPQSDGRLARLMKESEE